MIVTMVVRTVKEVGELPLQAFMVVICMQIIKLVFGRRIVVTVSFLRGLTLVMMMMFLPPSIHVCQLAMPMSMSMAMASYIQLDNNIVLQ